MRRGLIDTATVSQVVQCLDRRFKDQYPWSLESVLEITALLMRADHLALAPGLAPPANVVLDEQDHLIDLMLSNELVKSLQRPSRKSVATAITGSKRWIGRANNITEVKAEVNHLLHNSENFQNWIDWVVDNAWISHTKRLSGLFDETYLKYVARILNLTEADAWDLHRRSKDNAELRRLARVRDADFNLMTGAYIASAIIRGRYHEELAAQLDVQTIHHPLRSMISRRRTAANGITFSVDNATRSLAHLVLYGAMKQRRIQQRIESWVASIKSVRGILNRSGISFPEGSARASVDAAFYVAKQANIDVTNRGYDSFLELLGSVAVGALTSFYLSPWIDLSPWIGGPIGMAAGTAAMKRFGTTKRVRNTLAFHTHGHMLKEIAAGRIETEWQKGG